MNFNIALVLGLVTLAGTTHAAEITTFQAGDPITASGINQNFSELEARINALDAELNAGYGSSIPGEPFSYKISAGSATALPTGYDYYITDAISLIGSVYPTNCLPTSGITIVRYDGADILEITPLKGSECSYAGNHIRLNTPLLLTGGANLSVFPNDESARIIGYRVQQ